MGLSCSTDQSVPIQAGASPCPKHKGNPQRGCRACYEFMSSNRPEPRGYSFAPKEQQRYPPHTKWQGSPKQTPIRHQPFPQGRSTMPNQRQPHQMSQSSGVPGGPYAQKVMRGPSHMLGGPFPQMRGPSPQMMGGLSPQMRGPSPQMMGGPSPQMRGPSPQMMGGPSPQMRGPSSQMLGGPPPQIRGPSPHMLGGPSPQMMGGPSPQMMSGQSPQMISRSQVGPMSQGMTVPMQSVQPQILRNTVPHIPHQAMASQVINQEVPMPTFIQAPAQPPCSTDVIVPQPRYEEVIPAERVVYESIVVPMPKVIEAPLPPPCTTEVVIQDMHPASQHSKPRRIMQQTPHTQYLQPRFT